MTRLPYALVLAAFLAGCAVAPVPPDLGERAARGPDPAPFSSAAAHEPLPRGWHHFRLSRFKKPTRYELVPAEGAVALRATAEGSVSGLQYDTTVDLREYPWLVWRWKVPGIIEAADNSVPHAEDSPARVVLTFEGGETTCRRPSSSTTTSPRRWAAGGCPSPRSCTSGRTTGRWARSSRMPSRRESR